MSNENDKDSPPSSTPEAPPSNENKMDSPPSSTPQAPPSIESNMDSSSSSTPQASPSAKKKQRGMNFVRSAFLAFRTRPNKKPTSDPKSKATLHNVVGSMRPMHLQSDSSPRDPSPRDAQLSTHEHFDDGLSSPVSSRLSNSPSHSSTSEFASATNLREFDYQGTDRFAPAIHLRESASATNLRELDRGSEQGMNRFASAVNLRELDLGSNEGDEDKDGGEDETIDVKAERFIAQFYEQMRIQRHYHMARKAHRQQG